MSAAAAVSAAVVLIVVAGVAAAAEVAIATVSRVHAEELVRTGHRHAERLLRISADPPRYLNTATLLRIGSEISATVFVVVALQDELRGGWGFALAALLMALVSFVVVGVAPRTLARRYPERIALSLARPLTRVTALLGPVPSWLIALGSLAVGGRAVREGPFATEARLREVIDLAEQHSAIEADERVMIHRVFDLGDTLVREVMVPRTDIVSIPVGTRVGDAERLMLRSGFSRLPVTGPGGTDDITGLVYLKDLARLMLDDREAADADVDPGRRPPVWVPDSKSAGDLLRDMQRERVHIAVVVDEYGGTAGLVTIEDILEEIVGEITDEYDVAVAEPVELADGGLLVTSRIPLDDLGDLLGIELDDEDVDTVGGLLAKGLGSVPVVGDRTEIAGLSLAAHSSGGRRNRVDSVEVRQLRVPGEEPREPEESDPHEGSAGDDGEASGVGKAVGAEGSQPARSIEGGVSAVGSSEGSSM